MATCVEKIKWELFKIKREIMFHYGIKHNKIFAYDEEMLSKLRDYYFGALPLSVLFLFQTTVDGFCYYRAPFVVYAFLDNDFYYVSGDADSIKLNPEYIDQHKQGILGELYGEHAVIVRKIDEDLELVYDVSLGLIFEKEFYYKMDNFKPRFTRNKEETIERANLECSDGSNFDQNKYDLPLILPLFENAQVVQEFYTDALANEIKLLKEKSDYDKLIKNYQENKKRGITLTN